MGFIIILVIVLLHLSFALTFKFFLEKHKYKKALTRHVIVEQLVLRQAQEWLNSCCESEGANEMWPGDSPDEPRFCESYGCSNIKELLRPLMELDDK